MHKVNSHRAPVLQHVGHNVRRLRNAAGLSQSALADASGVSRRMLVAIEAGENNVSLATLDRVAEALDVAFSDLIQAPDVQDHSRINELAWAGGRPGSKAVLLSKALARREVELWEFSLEPGDCYQAESDPEGWSQQVYVIEGQLTLQLGGGEQPQRIEAGEFFMFSSHQTHAFHNRGAALLRFVRTVVL
ncbi:XRE family transcriptional regulator [Pseudomonas sp. DTU_2021_1001937_2_SI_NGA_ILE_001]|uniref:helix-turn-helix domain-containing protein n=1 Tax=Pseudomonas sp. DTU_2021_1001937_2_SI_NGA_ILE_001 TaxID=3077589 RepID=UPI0028FC1628|nr:XRE family transcriptional regulator [Pseudomonas sp. DTU_2021_1001937_2_SI_NGA_ILE_001]WNW10880.1 XRE family transcriptional regulator [Pseudomonas sp. DTU_2021_1001937_2_SI_NGA_ILE_001]